MKPKTFAMPNHLSGQDIRALRNKYNLTQNEFADLVNISKKTIERWEGEDKPITGPIVTLVKILKEYPQLQENFKIPPPEYPLRLWYMFRNEVSTIIDVDERERKIAVYNYTNNYVLRAFGREDKPTFEEYEDFLESRCFPKTRDKMKLMLEKLELPFYDPFMIIEKTEGRMAEDDCWIRIERGYQNDRTI